MKKSIKVVIIGVIMVGLIVVGVRTIRNKKVAEGMIAPAKSYAMVVTTFAPHWKKVRLSLPYIATVANDHDSVIASKVAARILHIVPVGKMVAQGELLVRLDDRDVRANIDALKAQIASARSALLSSKSALLAAQRAHERSAKLLSVRGVAQEQFEKEAAAIEALKAKEALAKANLASFEGKLATLKQTLTYTTIRAPITGQVVALSAHAGEMAMPGKPLLRIAAQKGAYLQLSMPDHLRPKGLIWAHEVVALTPLRATQRGLTLYRTPILRRALPTGQRVDVRVVVFDDQGVMLPHDALLQIDKDTYVCTYEKGRAVRQRVQILAQGEEGVVVADRTLVGKHIIVAKPDILLHLGGGVPVVARGH